MASALVFLLGLAVWRVTHALIDERGPLDIFVRFRAYLARKQKRSGGLFDLFSCFYCLSFWVAVIPALIFAGSLLTFILLTLILSSIAILIQRVFDKLR